ncbi:minor tail protein [Arthrobacter phage Amyev]|uniref:Minor tail protein n=1 Tax=Arthrobacter phage Amyev TaxID=2832315 RepID=A0AA48Y3S2_9CAUD|nr:minor tail protein [Arthrobacter phage Amyev]UIW13435.1 minor tail protein [Arthrobacter phage Amyev]
MTEWRFIAQRATTKQFLDLDVPLRREELKWELSGAGALRGVVAPDIGTMRASDGRLLLEEWGTLLYAEADGEIRWGGIVVSSKFEGSKWTVEAAGFATYPHGIAYAGDYYKALVDPAQVVRDIWGHLQSYADGNLGLTVIGSTNVRVGSPSEDAANSAASAAATAKANYDAANKVLATRRAAATAARRDQTAAIANRTAKSKALSAAKKTKNAAQIAAAQSAYNDAVAAVNAAKSVVTQKDADVKAQVTAVAGLKKTLDAANAKKKSTAAAKKDDGGAYKLQWWDSTDCGQEIDTLAKETPFDYTERHYWSGDTIKHELQIGYPRLGRRRDDLAFIQGDNVTKVITPSIDGDDFANEVVGIGSGEGKGAIHRTTAVRDGRLRRSVVYTAKDVTKADRMDALIQRELRARALSLDISEVTVRDHPNARIGSWALGDDVLIQATIPWLGEIELWCRITGWALTNDNTATLSLVRSDAFTYGG